MEDRRQTAFDREGGHGQKVPIFLAVPRMTAAGQMGIVFHDERASYCPVVLAFIGMNLDP